MKTLYRSPQFHRSRRHSSFGFIFNESVNHVSESSKDWEIYRAPGSEYRVFEALCLFWRMGSYQCMDCKKNWNGSSTWKVDHFIDAFCCSLRTTCRQMGLQSPGASNHHKVVDKAECLTVGMHRRCVSDAIMTFHIVLTNLEGHSLYYLLPFASSSRMCALESSVRNAWFLFLRIYAEMPVKQSYSSSTRYVPSM